MRTSLLLPAACMLLLGLTARADDATKDKATVKEIDLKKLTLKQVEDSFGQPKEITSAEVLARVFPAEEAQLAIKKDVDFGKVKLLYFAWSGSGQDKIVPVVKEADKKSEVVFTFQAGRTRDYRAHFHLFAVSKDAAWRIAK